MNNKEIWEFYKNLPHRAHERSTLTTVEILEIRQKMPPELAQNINCYADQIVKLAEGEVSTIQAIKWLHDLGVWLAIQS